MTKRVIRSLSAALPPGFDPEVIACREALRGRMAPWPVRVAGGDYGLEWQEQGIPVQQGLETAVRIGPWRYVLQVATGGGNFAPLGIDVGAMPPVVARALVAEFCADAVRMVERASGMRIELDAVWSLCAETEQNAAADDNALGFVLREQASGLCTRAALFPQDAAAFAGLARLCAGWPWQRAAGRAPWPLRCRLLLGSTRLAAWELGQLEVADVLFIEHPPPGRGRVRAALFFGQGETSAFLAQIEDREISIVDDNPSRQVMLDGDADDAAPGEASLLDRVELTVRFWIGGRRFAWREIQALQAGSVVTLDHDVADAEVLLVVDGQRIGRGRLVAVGDKLGVRIASIAPPDPQAPARSRPEA